MTLKLSDRHLALEGFPLLRQGFPKEPEDRIRELFLRRVVAIVCHALVLTAHNRSIRFRCGQ